MLLNHSADFATFEKTTVIKSKVPPLQMPPLRAAEIITSVAANTLIETSAGWKEAGDIAVGDLVHTLDGGLVPVATAKIRTLPIYSTQLWYIPEGVFDNCDSLRLTAGQHIMITSTACERLFDAPDVLIPVNALAGYRDICPCTSQSETRVIELAFEKEEIIYAQSGSLLMCPAADGETDDYFRTLSYGETRALLTLINGAHVGPDLAAPMFAAAA
ncbi:MAG: Hint domain-containing protein [Paracoccaceae bacterium]